MPGHHLRSASLILLTPMRIKPSLQEIRSAIFQKRVISFTIAYRKERVRVEPRILGQAARTKSYVILAWELGPDHEFATEPAEAEFGEWKLFRFSDLHDLEVETRMIRSTRPPCDLLTQIVAIDTCAVPVWKADAGRVP